MHSWTAHENSRLSFWLRVREFAVPPSMIECATARRVAGDWAGACAAARVDVDLDLRSAARAHGSDLAAQVRSDLRQLAPELLRWHLPRIAPDGLLRPGLTISLASYPRGKLTGHPRGEHTRHSGAEHDGGGVVHLVARTPPAWADAGQRFSLALWDGAPSTPRPCSHPHPRPDRRFRLDLHRHLWDARRTGELRARSGAAGPPSDGVPFAEQSPPAEWLRGCAIDRWADEARLLLRAQEGGAQDGGAQDGGAQGCGDLHLPGPGDAVVGVRLAARRRLVLYPGADAGAVLRIAATSSGRRRAALPVLPDAATWVLPDLELLRAGLVTVDRLHPLVAAALLPDCSPPGAVRTPDRSPPGVGRTSNRGGSSRLVECRGARHRIGLVNGALVALDHDPVEIRREELLAALGGTPLPCLRAIDEAHRRPEGLAEVRARLDHGDGAGALAAVEELLGPDAVLRSGALRDELESAALRLVGHGLFRAGLAGLGPLPTAWDTRRPRDSRYRPRHATSR